MSSSSSASPIKSSDPNPAYDITKEDIANIYTPDGHYNPEGGAAIHEKLAQGFPGRSNHVINANEYDRAFFTSDIHSDLRKFVQMLQNNGVIGTPILAYEEDIYDPALIADSEWTGGPRTILVIIGDLVDGRRIFDEEGTISNSVRDKRGSFEFLLFALLYNLRRKANREGSEVLFTIGNHEYDSIIYPALGRSSDYYKKGFVTNEAKRFFNASEKIRSEALIPFLNTSPYYILSFITSKIEVVCVHGGFHREGAGPGSRGYGFNLLSSLVNIQNDIDSNKSNLVNSHPLINEFLNTRIYNREGGFCDKIAEKPSEMKDKLSDFLLTIVGHCPTNSKYRSLELIRSDNDRYTGCDGRVSKEGEHPVGCVVVDCRHEDGAPKLAFVDTAMSHAFRPSAEDNSPRPVQMLLLTHDPALEDDKRYFNKIERVARVNDAGLGELTTVLYAAPVKSSSSASGTTSTESASSSSSSSPNAVVKTANATSTTGGRRSKRTRRTVKKHNLKKRRNSRKLASSRRTRRTVVRRL